MIIRNEQPSDYDAITEITIAAFRNEPHSEHTEQSIIHALRRANALILSLVAEIDGEVVGHVAFSPVTISGHFCDWYGVGPVSVRPDYQQRGIGKALMNEGLSKLKTCGAKGCVLVGDPDYYIRFGFRNHPELRLEGVPQEVFLALPFGSEETSGVVEFHEGFRARN